MAVAAEYKFNNATVRILDDEIRDVPADEMDRRIAAARRVAWQIWQDQYRQKTEDRANETEVTT